MNVMARIRSLGAHKLHWSRRAVQLGALCLFLVIPVAARYHNYLMARELDPALEKWEGSGQALALKGLDAFYRNLPEGERERADQIIRNREKVLEYAQMARGGPWSMELGPVSLTDPLAGAESLAASRSPSKVLWIGLAIPVLVAIALGRVFCSWICPMNLLLEMTDKLRRVLRFLEVKPLDFKLSFTTKYVVLVVGLALAALFSVPVLGYIYPPAVIGREIHALVWGFFDRAELVAAEFWMGGLTILSSFLLFIVVTEVALSRRWWCRYLCPGGALYSLLGRFRPVRVRLVAADCTGCAKCVPACHMGLNPMRDRMGMECDSCGLCMAQCEPGALKVSLENPFEKKAGS